MGEDAWGDGGCGMGAGGAGQRPEPLAVSGSVVTSQQCHLEVVEPSSPDPPMPPPLTASPALHAPPAGKTRGMGAGRKLRLHRKDEKWADKDYKKSHLGSEWKKPFAGASHAKGIVLEKM